MFLQIVGIFNRVKSVLSKMITIQKKTFNHFYFV